MAQIVKFPVQASRCGYRRVRKRSRIPDHPDQLLLFSEPAAQILSFDSGFGSFEQALILDERGDARAAEIYRKAIDIGDCPADAFCNLGIIESQAGRAAQAFDCFTEALKHDARHCEAHYNLANLYFELNDLRLAQVHYEMAGQVDPSFANVFFNLGLVQASTGQLAAAISSLTRYQSLATEFDARKADELLQNLKRSLVAARGATR